MEKSDRKETSLIEEKIAKVDKWIEQMRQEIDDSSKITFF